MGLFDKIKEIARITDHINIGAAQSHIVSNIDFRGPNIWILAFAIIIASVGLNVNSIPVIIGAMLISPLMGPIMGVGLALGINDTTLLKKALTNLVIMTSISILASTLFFLISPLRRKEPTTILIAAAFSTCIEAVQFIFKLGLCETDDVIMNTLGAAIGTLSYVATQRINARKE